MQFREEDIALINALATGFYDVVPHEFQTYCSLTARITQSALTHFGFEAKLLPCQVWLATSANNYVVGFLGKTAPGKWDGHVVCRVGPFIIDAALMHFEKEFGLNVPSVAVSSCFDVPTQVISRRDLSADVRLWWHYPPAQAQTDLRIPAEPDDVVGKYAAQLIDRLAMTLNLAKAAPNDRASC